MMPSTFRSSRLAGGEFSSRTFSRRNCFLLDMKLSLIKRLKVLPFAVKIFQESLAGSA